MVKVGTEEHHIILAGCQIHYAVSCPDRPHQGITSQVFTEDKGEATVRSNQIYIPEPTEDEGETIIDKVATAKTYDFLKQLGTLDMDSEEHRKLLGEKAASMGVRFFQTIREPYHRTYNLMEVMWGDGSETREVLRSPNPQI